MKLKQKKRMKAAEAQSGFTFYNVKILNHYVKLQAFGRSKANINLVID